MYTEGSGNLTYLVPVVDNRLIPFSFATMTRSMSSTIRFTALIEIPLRAWPRTGTCFIKAGTPAKTNKTLVCTVLTHACI